MYNTIESLIKENKNWRPSDFVFLGYADCNTGLTSACLNWRFPCSFMFYDRHYNSVEQCMLAEKSRLVGLYGEEMWKNTRYEVAVDVNMAKFWQNPRLKQILIDTGDKIIVEDSLQDVVWGIGLEKSHPDAVSPKKWLGTNLFGFALMEVRDVLNVKREGIDEATRQRIQSLLDKRKYYYDWGWSDKVDPKLWLSDMNSVNVTLLMDRLITGKGYIVMKTGAGDANCISLLNINWQSDGFRLAEVIETREAAAIVLRASNDFLKGYMRVPGRGEHRYEYYEEGFVWGPENNPEHYIKISTPYYGHHFILNFSVCGEFDLSIYFLPDGQDDELIWVYGKSFCCK